MGSRPQIGQSLPSDLSQLGQGRKIVSFKGLNDRQRYQWISKILKAVLTDYAQEESDRLRLILYVDEAHLITKRRVDEQAKEAAGQAEMALDRLVREGRKYGICVVIASQTIKDFSHGSASVRQNTNTKIFLRNSDREVEYASDFIERGRDIIDLGVGEAFVHNAAWGVVKVRFRPPYSKVWDFGSDATRQIIHAKLRDSVAVGLPAQSLFEVISAMAEDAGSGPHLSQLAQATDMTSKRKLLNLVDELERAGWVKTQTLAQRGQPRIVTPIRSENRADETPDKSRTKWDETL